MAAPDFRFTQQVPTNEIIQAGIQKPVLESQMETAAEQRRVSRLESVRKLSHDISGMVDGFVQRAKMRQKNEAIHSLANIFKEPAMDKVVGQKEAAMPTGVEGPGLPVPQTYGETPMGQSQRAREMKALLTINPDDVTKARAQQLFPKPSAGVGSSSWSSDQVDAILSGDYQQLSDSFAGAVPAEALRRFQQATQQGLIQGRFDTGIATKKQKTAADEGKKTTDQVNALREGRSLLEQMEKDHKALFKEGLAGDPLTAKATGLANKYSGGRIAAGAGAFDKTRNAVVTRMKAIVGQSGVLSDQDTARLDDLLPSRSETPDEAHRKIQIINKILTLGIGNQEDRLEKYLQTLGYKTIPKGQRRNQALGGGSDGIEIDDQALQDELDARGL